jgi:hypothetical protein
VFNDALTQLVRRTYKFRLKGTKLSKRFAKTTSQFKLVFAVCRQKTFATNQNVQEDHVIHGEIKEIHIHASGRFIVNNDKGNFVALRLIIKKKTFIHAIISFVYISNL